MTGTLCPQDKDRLFYPLPVNTGLFFSLSCLVMSTAVIQSSQPSVTFLKLYHQLTYQGEISDKSRTDLIAVSTLSGRQLPFQLKPALLFVLFFPFVPAGSHSCVGNSFTSDAQV